MTIRIGQKIGYFLSSQSGGGLVTYFRDVLRLQKRSYIIKGGTSQIRSKIIRNIGIELMDRGYDIEIAYGILNPDNLEGIIIPQLGLALISGDSEFQVKGYSKEIDLDQYQDQEKYLVYKSKIGDLSEQITVNFELAFVELHEVCRAFTEKCTLGTEVEERQALYITEKLLSSLFTLEEGKMNHRFAQALTSRGLINYFPRLIETSKNKYYLNGVKYIISSKILNLVAREAVLKGLTVDVYHNFLDPQLIDLIILEEMGLAIASRPFTRDFQELITYDEPPKVDADSSLEKLDFKGVIKWLREIEDLYDKCWGFYNETLDFTGITELETKLLQEIIEDYII